MTAKDPKKTKTDARKVSGGTRQAEYPEGRDREALARRRAAEIAAGGIAVPERQGRSGDSEDSPSRDTTTGGDDPSRTTTRPTRR